MNGLDETDDAFPSEEEYVGFSLDDAGDDFPPDEKYVIAATLCHQRPAPALKWEVSGGPILVVQCIALMADKFHQC